MAKPQPWLQPAVVVGGFSPLVVMGWQASRGGLGANPVATALNQLGLLSLTFLIASLACTPLKLLFGVTWPIRLRRTLGLMAFAYVTVHLLTYVAVDQGFDVPRLWEDVVKRPFITLGFLAWLLLIPLALTSTAASVRRLGFPAWQRLHRLAYLCGVLGVVHFYLRVKKDVTQPLVFAAVLAVLFGVRVNAARRKQRARTSSP